MVACHLPDLYQTQTLAAEVARCGSMSEAVEAVGFELRCWVIDIEDLIGVADEEGITVDEEKRGGGEGVEVFGVGEVECFGEGGEETGVFALAGEDFAEDFAEVAGGGYGVAGEKVLF
jgi:hypothetical protein